MGQGGRRYRRARRRSKADDRRARRVGRARRLGRVVGLVVVGLVAAALLTDIGDSSDDRTPPDTGRRPTTTLAPPDVDEARAPIDLAEVPAGDDPVEVARWWAAAYTAYIGTDAPDALADRLSVTTTERLRVELAEIPPAASYDAEPAPIEGVSTRAPVEEGGHVQVRVTVETAGALTVYDLTLVADGRGRWLVDEAARL
jgi:hypothetical protein